MLPPPVSMLVQDSGAGMGTVELAQTPGDHQAAALLEGGGRAPDPLQPPQLLGLHLVADTVQTVFTIFAEATTGTFPLLKGGFYKYCEICIYLKISLTPLHYLRIGKALCVWSCHKVTYSYLRVTYSDP